MVATTPRVHAVPAARDLLLVGGLAGSLVGVSMVAMSFGPGADADGGIASITRLARPDAAATAPPPDSTASEDTVDGECTAGCATAFQPPELPRSRSDEGASSLLGQPVASNRDPATPPSSAISLTSRPFDVRDWLFIGGMFVGQ